jgi:alkanesulfonate monooxygenase SsuD/methylene tetrahydromethanopterin reductase-like flavin-dependent oxidoreductase (luciferase family)
VTCSEHVVVPTSAAATRGTRYYDPLATFGFLAAQTERLRFVTHVLVLGYHHPLAIAKRYGTLDRIANGRLVLGVGVGTLEEEFRVLGARFDGRGPVYEDAIRALRAAFGGASRATTARSIASRRRRRSVRVQERIPIWLGGRTPRRSACARARRRLGSVRARPGEPRSARRLRPRLARDGGNGRPRSSSCCRSTSGSIRRGRTSAAPCASGSSGSPRSATILTCGFATRPSRSTSSSSRSWHRSGEPVVWTGLRGAGAHRHHATRGPQHGDTQRGRVSRQARW